MEGGKEPLADVKNVAMVRPVSRLPTPGSKLPTTGNKLLCRRRPASGGKRKAESDSEPEISKKFSISKLEPNKKARNNLVCSTKAGNGKLVEKKRNLSSSRNLSGSSITSSTSANRKAPAAAGRSARPQSTKPAARQPVAPAAKPSSKKPTAPTVGGGKKRPIWDLKGRLQDMENINNMLANHNTLNNERLAALESLSANLEGTVTEKEQGLSSASQTINDLESRLRDSQRDLETMRQTLTRQVENLEFDKSSLLHQKATLDSDLNASRQECSGLKLSVATLSSTQAGLSAELTSTKLCLEQMIKENKELKALVASHEKTIEEQHENLVKHESERRILHNTIQELKGNIRVFCRVRPLIGEELLGNDGNIGHINFPDADTDGKIVELEKMSDALTNESSVNQRRGSNNTYEFSFDKVFSPNTSQKHVYNEISQLIQSALDGYHVCIFAYGQTGSGKTFTMEGPNNPDEETEGMIPRAVNQVFSSSAVLQEKGWQYDMEVSFLEIYNETIRDLLDSGKEDVKHEIKMTSANSSEVVVTNLTTVNVSDPTQVYKLLSVAGENRAVAETKCNSRSSRSHSVFQMKISGHNSVTGEKCTGLLNLIDLAGSERLKESGSQGQRLKETQSINKSLSNLGNVIMALANKDQHIPYRNSKLTHLLQHCLGGNSKVLMFVNVSPREECFNETLNSVRFATKVNNCNIGTAQKKIK